MKVTVHEYGPTFSIELMGESLEDAAFLVRFGMNRKTDVLWASSYVDEEGKFSGFITLRKRANASGEIVRRK